MSGPHIRRLYYSTAEVSKMVDVRPYIIRKWEKKFPFFNSIKKHSGRKFFKPSDVETVKRIKKLKDIGYTNEKINKIIASHDSSESINFIDHGQMQEYSTRPLLLEIYKELREILKILDSDM